MKLPRSKTDWIMLVGGGAALVLGAHSLWWGHASKQWPRVDAVVTESRAVHGLRSNRFEVRYEFDCGGRRCSGDRWHYRILSGSPDTFMFSDSGSRIVEATAASYAKGQRVQVAVRPGDPARSVLEPGISSDDIFIAAIGLLLFALAFAPGAAAEARGAARLDPPVALRPAKPRSTAALVLAVIGSVLMAIGLYDIYRGIVSSSWPEVAGTVLYRSLSSGSGMGATGRAVVRYEYAVGGKRYLGDASVTGPGDRAEVWIAPLATGGAARVRVNPRDASDSTLDPGVGWRHLLPPAFALILFGVAWVLQKVKAAMADRAQARDLASSANRAMASLPSRPNPSDGAAPGAATDAYAAPPTAAALDAVPVESMRLRSSEAWPATDAAAGFEDDAKPFTWTPAERESFFAAIERHRQAAWRVSAACGLTAGVLALVMAFLLTPLIVCIVVLAFDLINLVVPMPNLAGFVGSGTDAIGGNKPVSTAALVAFAILFAIPGLLLMALVGVVLRRAMRTSALFDAGEGPGRAPDPRVLAEQRFANVVEEMAIAAVIPQPHVRVVAGSRNAAVFGRDDDHTTILVGDELLEVLKRDQMQGVAAHLIASIADGDMKIGFRAATTLAFFALMSRFSALLSNRDGWRSSVRMLRTLAWPTAASATQLMQELNDPMRDDTPAAPAVATRSDKLTWREWVQIPLMGPIAFGGFLSGLVSTFVLAPLISLAWRQRKYMADATAVRLTRDPDAMAGALEAIGGAALPAGVAHWTSHLGVAGAAGRGGSILSSSFVPVMPPLPSRLKALMRMGASSRRVAAGPFAQLPIWMKLFLVGAYSLCFVLGGIASYLLVIVAAAITGLFLVLPTALLHAVLRAIGH